MFDFAENTKDMTAAEILNYYRNLYYAEPQVTERGIVANAINDILPNMVEVVRCKDCDRFKPGEDGIFYCYRKNREYGVFMKKDDFCSYGKRRTDHGK